MIRRLTYLVVFFTFFLFVLVITEAIVSAEVILKEYEPGQLLKETNFNEGSGLPWHIVETAPAEASFELTDGRYYVTIEKVNPSGGERWDLQFRHRELFVESGHTYTLSFTISASNDCQIYTKIGDQNEPYFEDWNMNQNWEFIHLTAGQPVTITQTFTANRTAEVLEWAFHLADAPVGTVFWFDDLSLTDPQFAGHSPETRPNYRDIRVNQLGYFPNREKLATLHTEATSPVEWRLEDSFGYIVDSGMTEVFGFDNDSGEHVHIIDFSDFNQVGRDYKLYADSEPVYDGGDSLVESYPFDIADDMYNDMLYDSLKYFYHSRSGIPIEEEYVQRPDLAREAGHPVDIMETSTTEQGDWAYNESFTVDVTGGWYDAGDHGKYVVNGGITLWTLQNMYERMLYTDDDISALGDNTMNIPESGNGIPDILDEARYHMEVMLKMQVPEGYDRAGMVFHKGHDHKWTGLATSPAMATQLVADGEINRILKPPTTAATLNFAATGAQAYRLWLDYDQGFANGCLAAAERAWVAAVANPAIYAPYDESVGGGPYGDDYVLDDFYWAASELYVATGKAVYRDYLQSSPHYLEVPNYLEAGEETHTVGQFNWGNTAALGTLTLALVPNDLASADIETARDNIATAADFTLNIQANQGYGITIEPSPVMDTGLVGYPWGSNSFVTNSSIVLAYAFDYTNEEKYLNGVTEAMDYMMGRNPNERVYITGYGDYPIQYPHHRFFSHQVDPSFPIAPPGITNGGPNSGLQDPWVKGSGWQPGERAPQKSFMDHIESWSTNECTINWNAPMAWVTSFLAQKGNNNGDVVDIIPGDVNDDGSVNSLDYILVCRYILGILAEFPTTDGFDAADLNNDGSVNTIDYVLLRELIQ
ncbi:cellulase [Iocasia frigidifontis]|uniref:Glucanase n=1 Tax=Iocasia fonsfrigidae TaxID=2682810 RepID=A0A8A7KGZ9_9FIRM|nr:glycoside hydrolase family 9 protein [Iocasia fonsfrigidae]QTL97152.1 cellulase [Iocasia fonsfrigidae]